MNYLTNFKHSIIGAGVACIMYGFTEYQSPISAIAFAVGFWMGVSIILAFFYGLIWIIMPKTQREKYTRDNSE